MNKTELKNFAVSARRDLLEKVALRAKIFGIDEKNDLTIEEKFGHLAINGETYPIDKKSAFLSLKRQLEIKGYEQLIEEVAYTWFNRIIAIRYMEVNEYLPEKVNVLSSSTGKVEPDILSEFETMDLDVETVKVKELIRQGETEAAYRKLFIAQCNALHNILPFLFERIDDYTEILLPDFLLDNESVISQLVKMISRDNFHNDKEGRDNVEVLGWLYQYYLSEKKEKVGGLNNIAVVKEDLPVVTQLFTPKWIVQYMVQNSLGKLYDDKFPNNKLVTNWEYYLKSSTEEHLITDLDSLEQIKIIDPACGSGHILLYAFDMLYNMYEEAGYPSREISKLILEKNLYGLDIDRRAIQIANFALIMKAVEKQPRFFKKNKVISLNIFEIIDSDYSLSEESINFFTVSNEEKEIINSIQSTFKNGKQFGSLLSPAKYNYYELILRMESFRLENEELIEQAYIIELKKKLLPLLSQAYLLSKQYDIVVTNPPYHNKYNSDLKDFLIQFYSDYKADLYSAFIYRTTKMIKVNGYSALMTPFTWMYITSHKKLRKYILSNLNISSLVQLEYSAFKEATVPICAFVFQNQNSNSVGEFVWLENFKGEKKQPEKVREAVENPNVSYRFRCNNQVFLKIEETPLLFWVSENMRNLFISQPNLGTIAEPKQGLATADDNTYLRLWHEVQHNKIGFALNSRDAALESKKKWFPFNKGGSFRKWYGNQTYVINWENDGHEVKNFKRSVIRNITYYFNEGITWGLISSGSPSFRYSPFGFIPGHKGPVIYFSDTEEDIKNVLGVLNSKVVKVILKSIAPNIGFEVGQLKRIPIGLISFSEHTGKQLSSFVDSNISISKNDWDSFEISWDFTTHPFLNFKNDSSFLADCFDLWSKYKETQFKKSKENEEEINRISISLYGLQDEISPEISEDEITLRRADKTRDTKSFLSYFIGCVMGRYSLTVDGLTFAGGVWNDSKYEIFTPNKYGIIQMTDEQYFEDDILARLREFLSVTFGKETIDQNLQWLAESLELKRNETAEERLRRYFLDEFFKDHCQVYQKRPIYWLVDSGKHKGLRTFIYMHRYQPDTMATIRFEHLQEIQAKYNNEIAAIDLRIVNPNLSATEKRDLEKQKTAFQKRMEELLEFDKKLAEYANAQIEIDLDDGVNANYVKFDKVLAKIK